MGTRADFYIGTGPSAEWLGSVAFDGYEWDEDKTSLLMTAETPDEFRGAVDEISRERDDFTSPAEGWPWPWNTSATTDYAYAFVDGTTKAFVFSGEWPDMSARKNVQMGHKSGAIIICG